MNLVMQRLFAQAVAYQALYSNVDFSLMYSRLEDPKERLALDYFEGKWYMPTGAVPRFKINIHRGTVRRIQYTMKNTEKNGFEPEPCIADWPQGTFTGTVEWEIGHCRDLVTLSFNRCVSV